MHIAGFGGRMARSLAWRMPPEKARRSDVLLGFRHAMAARSCRSVAGTSVACTPGRRAARAYRGFMDDNIIDIRESTLGFKINGTASEITINYKEGLIILYTTKEGHTSIIEGSNKYIVNVLAKDGINAVIREKM